MEKFNFDEVEDLFDDMADMMADQEDIQEMMGRNFGVEYDESDLLDELNELDEEIIGDQLNEGLETQCLRTQSTFHWPWMRQSGRKRKLNNLRKRKKREA